MKKHYLAAAALLCAFATSFVACDRFAQREVYLRPDAHFPRAVKYRRIVQFLRNRPITA